MELGLSRGSTPDDKIVILKAKSALILNDQIQRTLPRQLIVKVPQATHRQLKELQAKSVPNR